MSAALVGYERCEGQCEGLFNQTTKNSFQNRAGTTRPLRGMGARRNFTEAQQSGHAPRTQMRDNSEGCGLNVAGYVRRRFMKTSPFILSYIDKQIIEGCDYGSQFETVCINVSPPQRVCAVLDHLSRGRPKWRDKYTEGPNHPVAPNRLDYIFSFSRTLTGRSWTATLFFLYDRTLIRSPLSFVSLFSSSYL